MKYLVVLLIGLLSNVYGQNGQIIGVVKDAEGTLPGVSVRLNEQWHTVSDMEGHFQFDMLPSGNYELKIAYLGYQQLEKKINLKPDEILDLGQIKIELSTTELAEVSVLGSLRQGGRSKAVTMIRISDKNLSVISAEGIARSPVRGTAQIIRQAPGVAVRENKVSLRGTPAEWTTSLINGDPLPTADEHDASRVFNFEVLPANLIDYIVINRTVTPDMDGDNIGGIINFMTKAPVEEELFSIDVSGGYDVLSRRPLGMGNFIYGNSSKNKRFSYVVNGSIGVENNSKDAPSVAYGTNYNHSLARLQLDRDREFRQTVGANAAISYKANSALTLGANFMLGMVSEDEHRTRTSFNWSDGSGQRIRLWNSSGLYLHNLYGGAITANWKPSPKLSIDARVASYSNSFRFGKTPSVIDGAPNGNYTIEYISPLLEYTDMIETNFFGEVHDPNHPTDPNPYPYKMLDIDNPYGTGGDHYNNIQPRYTRLDGTTDPLTASDFYLSSAFADMNSTWEKDPITGKIDLNYKHNNALSFKTGMRFRKKEGERSVNFFEYRLLPGTGRMSLSNEQTTAFDPNNDFLNEWNNPYSNSLFPMLTRDRLNTFIKDHQDSLVALPMDLNNNEYMYWAGSSYRYTEDVMAGYVMADWKPSPQLTLTGGLRIEHTRLRQNSDTIVSDFNAPVGIAAQRVSIDRNYLALLPSLNALYTIDRSSNLRGAVSRTFHRPNFEQTKPGFAMFDRFSYLFTFGNPGLKPTYAINLDLNYQYFWGTKGMFSIGAYYKHIDDHIFVTNEVDEGNQVPGYVVKSYRNAERSYVAGVEILLEKQLTFLPGLLSGLGVAANVTYAHSRMDVPGRSFPQALTEQTPLMYNLSLFYEKGRINSRAMLNHTGAFATELNLFTDIRTNELIHDNTDFDVFVGSMLSLDYQFGYTISKSINIYANVNNILNTAYRTYRGVPERPLSTIYTRQKFYLGFRFNL